MPGLKGQFRVRSNMRGLRLEAFTFDTLGASDPTVWDDSNTGLVSGITEAATGLFTVTLNQSFKSVVALASTDSPDHEVAVTGTTENTIVIQNTDNADPKAAEITTGDTITVICLLADV